MPGAKALLFAHHPKKEWGRCCFPFPMGVQACARCLGIILGAFFALAFQAVIEPWLLFLAVLVSFFHWGSERLGFLVWGKYTRLGVGFCMGAAYASALREAVFSSPLPAAGAAVLSLVLLAGIILAKQKKLKKGKKKVWIGV